MVGWHHRFNGHERGGDHNGHRSLVVLQSMGLQRVRHYLATEQQPIAKVTKRKIVTGTQNE